MSLMSGFWLCVVTSLVIIVVRGSLSLQSVVHLILSMLQDLGTEGCKVKPIFHCDQKHLRLVLALA